MITIKCSNNDYLIACDLSELSLVEDEKGFKISKNNVDLGYLEKITGIKDEDFMAHFGYRKVEE